MVNVKGLGWDADTVGELDHRLLKAPHVKLRSFSEGEKGDVVYCVDFGSTALIQIIYPQPNCIPWNISCWQDFGNTSRIIFFLWESWGARPVFTLSC